MFNPLLDRFPDSYNGYDIETSFRMGVMMSLALQDENLEKEEQFETAVKLLYVDAIPDDAEECARAIKWYLNGWNHDNHKSSSTVVMDFNVDAGRIYSAFMHQYNIDLNVTDLHFWQFMILLTNLEECAFTRVIDIRAKKMSDLKTPEERKAYAEAKKVYSLNQKKADENDAETAEAVNEFLQYLGGNDKGI